MKNAEKPILSISLLASDRLDTLPRCLESLNHIREEIPCELIIVDTSNNPDVHECILKYTDIVESFKWCNDFSKARNVGVRKAKGEWFMFLDDDEWFLEDEPLIEFFKSGEYKKYGYAHYVIRNYLDVEFKRYSDGWVRRLTKMQKDTKFCSKVHEYLSPCTGENKSLNTIVGHTGYIFKTTEERIKHFKRNSSLLDIMEEEEPDNMRWKTHQIQEYCSIGVWGKLEEYCKEILSDNEKEKKILDLTFFSQVCAGYALALFGVKKYDEVKTFYKSTKEVLKKTLLARAYMESIMVDVCYRLEEYELVKEHVSNYLAANEVYKRDPKKYERESIQIIIGGVFSPAKNCDMKTALLVSELHLGNYETFYEMYPKVDWNTPNQQLYYNVHVKIIETLIILNDVDMLRTFIKDGLSSEFINKKVVKTIVEWQKRDAAEFIKILDVVKDVDIWEWYKIYIEVLLTNKISTEEAKEIGASFIKSVPNVLQIPDSVHKAFKERGIELEGLFTELDFMTWKSHLVEHFTCINMQQLDALKVRLENSSIHNDVRFAYFMMIYAEQKLLNTDEEAMGFEEYNELLYAFSTNTCNTFETLYADEIQEMTLEQLPSNYQAALWLKVYFEEVEKDIKAALPCLSKVIEVYPMLSDVMKGYLKCIQREIFE